MRSLAIGTPWRNEHEHGAKRIRRGMRLNPRLTSRQGSNDPKTVSAGAAGGTCPSEVQESDGRLGPASPRWTQGRSGPADDKTHIDGLPADLKALQHEWSLHQGDEPA